MPGAGMLGALGVPPAWDAARWGQFLGCAPHRVPPAWEGGPVKSNPLKNTVRLVADGVFVHMRRGFTLCTFRCGALP